MLSSLRIICRRGIVPAHTLGKPFHRTFMSENFRCNDAWSRRLSSPILRQVNISEMYVELDSRLDSTGRASAIDVDIFANAFMDGEHLDELDDLVHRFRLGSGATDPLPSTHHAVVRAFLDNDETSDLLRILNDRLNYGIFPDDYTNVLLLDHFIKRQDFTSAAKIACLRMLQEDFSNPLVNYMSLFACHKYLLSPTEWEAPEEPAEPDSGEEIKVRVKYLRNPYFDDHFDLKDPNALIGKTFHLMCMDMSDPIGTNYRALGLCLHKKWNEAEKFISDCEENGNKFYSATIELIDKFIGSLPEDEQKTLDSLKSVITVARDSSIKNDLLPETIEKVKSLVQSEEKKMIEQQIQEFLSWENSRENILKAELDEIKKEQRLKEVQTKKEELRKEEQEIFFFDNEDQMDIAIENKRVRYPKKWPGKKKKKRVAADEYVPPEISIKRPGGQ